MWMTIKHKTKNITLNNLPRMKIILIIPCILSVSGVVDVVAAADKHLRGSSRALQYGGDNVPVGAYGDYNDRPMYISTNDPDPTKSSSMSIQLPPQPLPTLEDISGSNLFAISSNPGGFLPTDLTESSIFGIFGGFGSIPVGDVKNNFGT
jgi:hypothetical protein